MIIVRIVKFVSLLVIEVPMFLTRIASAWAAPERCDLTPLIPVTHQPPNRSLPMACSGTTTRERQREKDSETSLRRPNTTGKKMPPRTEKYHRTMSDDDSETSRPLSSQTGIISHAPRHPPKNKTLVENMTHKEKRKRERERI